VQSPIDLTQWDNTNSGDLKFNSPSSSNTDVTLETNTWTRVVHWGTQTSEEASVTYNGVAYYLRNFSYRSPSENTVRAEYSDMEVQYQHESIGGNGLVLSVRMTCDGSNQNEFMQQFWHRFPDTTDERASASVSNPYSQGDSKALPNDLSFYRWEGAWSNPPCTRHWVWIMFHELIECSSEQMRTFREDINKIPNNKLVVRSKPYGVSNNWDESLGCNNRNLQSVGTRTVYFHAQSGSTGGNDDDDDDHHHSARREWYQRWWVWILLCLLYCCCAACCLGLAYTGSESGLFAAATDKQEPKEEEQPLQEKPPKVLDMEYHEEDDGAPYHVAKPKHHHHSHSSHGSHQVQSVGDYTYVPSYANQSRSSYMQQESFALPPSASFGQQMYSTGGPHPLQASHMSSMALPSATALPGPRLPPTAAAPTSARRFGGMDSLAMSG